MRHSPQTSCLEARVRAAWQTQMAAAINTPGLLPDLGHRRHELFPRFAVYYTQLQALPRRVRRVLQRQWRLPLAGVALVLALGQQPGLAATIPVVGTCTLVDAITAANTDTATGGCPMGSGADTIVLPVGSAQTLTEVNNNTYGPTGLPVISSVITIVGQGSTIVRDSTAPDFRILAVGSTGDLTLNETTVSGGRVSYAPGIYFAISGGGIANYGGTLTITNSTISGNSASANFFLGNGGGVFNASGPVTITNSTITGNTASYDGGVFNASGPVTITNSTIAGNTAFYGGGVGNNGTLTITNSTIAGNTAHGYFFGYGGGVRNDGTLTLANSTITGNSARSSYSDANSFGGGVFSSGTVTITNSTIAGNTASSGGGVDNDGTLTLANSTITGNSGGGVDNDGTLTLANSTITGNTASFGGGVRNSSGTLTLANSTITGNSGGGVFNGNYGTLTMLNSTITGNSAAYVSGGGVRNSGSLTLAHTLVSGNTAPTALEIGNYGTVVADNHNLFGVDGTAGVEGFSTGATDIIPPTGIQLADILDPTLAFNGGPTQTHALVPDSPAIDAGGPVCLDATGAPLLTDQRGKSRLVDGDGDGTAACDIGAFEFFPIVNDRVALVGDVDTAFDPTPVVGGPAGTFTLTATFTNTSDTPLRFPFFGVSQLTGDNLVLNADGAPGGVGATVTPEVEGNVLAPGAEVTAEFVIGLQEQEPFTFFVNVLGEPLP